MENQEFVYIVKYAATKGIFKISKELMIEKESPFYEERRRIIVRLKQPIGTFGTWQSFVLDLDCTYDLERANILANQLLEKKAESLARQLAKVRQKLELSNQRKLKIKELN